MRKRPSCIPIWFLLKYIRVITISLWWSKNSDCHDPSFQFQEMQMINWQDFIISTMERQLFVLNASKFALNEQFLWLPPRQHCLQYQDWDLISVTPVSTRSMETQNLTTSTVSPQWTLSTILCVRIRSTTADGRQLPLKNMCHCQHLHDLDLDLCDDRKIICKIQ